MGHGDWFDLEAVTILSYRQELDLKQGTLARTVRFRDAAGSGCGDWRRHHGPFDAGSGLGRAPGKTLI